MILRKSSVMAVMAKQIIDLAVKFSYETELKNLLQEEDAEEVRTRMGDGDDKKPKY